ncbi:peptidoglycan-binding domain-containing protein [Neorhizobium sp. S3-V5DH]|uniref:peptidoglycan-binding domain-containing protein n=1 Tax=Neorhizobium sp. S3-V5DH TaxID=2485166 RepID=UPI0010522E15|nr:peptidoglycan-binding domain-containing protein [Neorhizobium sp. S3-V5DH]TCV71452.1 putative peptidoglycan binding protein [Neorhizobium sp. S3-V5DH]
MTARKRKSPDRKKAVRQPGLLSNLASAAGRAALRHPKPLFGFATLGIVFSFVAANALWYQPGGHPAPFLATRDADDPNAIAGYRPVRRTAPADTTTFRIERASPAVTAPSVAVPVSEPVAAPVPAMPPAPRPQTAAPLPAAPMTPKPAPVETARAPAPASVKPAQPAPAPIQKAALPRRPAQNAGVRSEDPVAAAIRAAERLPSMTPPAEIPNARRVAGSIPAAARPPAAVPAAVRPSAATSPSTDLVLQIQRGLSNIAYADVEVDGVAGEQTKAAIRRFEKHYRLPETGEPNAMVLKKLKSIGAL